MAMAQDQDQDQDRLRVDRGPGLDLHQQVSGEHIPATEGPRWLPISPLYRQSDDPAGCLHLHPQESPIEETSRTKWK